MPILLSLAACRRSCWAVLMSRWKRRSSEASTSSQRGPGPRVGQRKDSARCPGLRNSVRLVVASRKPGRGSRSPPACRAAAALSQVSSWPILARSRWLVGSSSSSTSGSVTQTRASMASLCQPPLKAASGRSRSASGTSSDSSTTSTRHASVSACSAGKARPTTSWNGNRRDRPGYPVRHDRRAARATALCRRRSARSRRQCSGAASTCRCRWPRRRRGGPSARSRDRDLKRAARPT